MASAYAHKTIANEILSSEKISAAAGKDKQLYLLASQGPDFAFFCPKKNGENVGKLLHRRRVYEAFSALLALSRKDGRFTPFSLGFCSHYATDVIFHGYIYPFLEESGGGKILHARLERAMDRYFARLKGEKLSYSFVCADEGTASIFSSATAALGANFSPSEILRGFKKYRLYLSTINSLFAYSPSTAEKEKWRGLYSSSVDFSKEVCLSFLCGLDGGILDKALFSRNYLGEEI